VQEIDLARDLPGRWKCDVHFPLFPVRLRVELVAHLTALCLDPTVLPEACAAARKLGSRL
jgi:hypothetical protein